MLSDREGGKTGKKISCVELACSGISHRISFK